jgi:hypothetical protein
MMKKVVLDEEKYLRFYELIQIRTGIRIGDNRREVLTHALRASGESMECADLDQIFSRLQDAPTDSEVWNDLIRKVTIGDTYFFSRSKYYRNTAPTYSSGTDYPSPERPHFTSLERWLRQWGGTLHPCDPAPSNHLRYRPMENPNPGD